MCKKKAKFYLSPFRTPGCSRFVRRPSGGLSNQESFMFNRAFHALGLIALIATGCGDTVINQPAGITCSQDEQCPWEGLVCVAGLCKTEPIKEEFYFSANPLWDFVTEDGTTLMVWANENTSFTAQVITDGDVVARLSGAVVRRQNLPLQIKGLQPETPYLVLFHAVSLSGPTQDATMDYWAEFKTTVAKPKDMGK